MGPAEDGGGASRSPRPEDEARLARAAASGDREAFATLYRLFAPLVHGVLLAHGPRAEVDDGVQEVFLAALRAIGGLEDPTRVGAWLAAIARNHARDRLRRALPVEPAVLEELPENPAEPANDDESERVLAHVRALPEAYRETLVLRLVEGLSGPEIARRTGMTPGSVRVNLHRGMKQLRERLEREERTRTPGDAVRKGNET